MLKREKKKYKKTKADLNTLKNRLESSKNILKTIKSENNNLSNDKSVIIKMQTLVVNDLEYTN